MTPIRRDSKYHNTCAYNKQKIEQVFLAYMAQSTTLWIKVQFNIDLYQARNISTNMATL